MRAESERFHSAIVKMQIRGVDGPVEMTLTQNALADTGAGWDYLPGYIARKLKLRTVPIASVSCCMADGTHMQGPDTAADTEIMFPEATKKRWYGQRFQIQKSDEGPCIIGNDFWARHRAMFDFNSRTILLLKKNGKIKDRIPFTCSRPGPNCAAAVVDQGDGHKPSPMLVRATRDMLLQPVTRRLCHRPHPRGSYWLLASDLSDDPRPCAQ